MARSTVAPEDAGGAQFRRSPISYLIDRNLDAQRWKLEDRKAVETFGVRTTASCEGSAAEGVRTADGMTPGEEKTLSAAGATG